MRRVLTVLALLFGAFATGAPQATAQSLAPVVAMVSTPSGDGYWIAQADGRVSRFGDAAAHGDLTGRPPASPIVGMARTASGGGYWLTASDGGVFAFGDARFLGSMGGRPLNRPVVGMAPTPSGAGYWLVASDGGIFAFGDATFRGSMGGQPLNRPVVGMAPTPTGAGYWLVASDGGIFAFGNATFRGSMGGQRLNEPITAMSPAADGSGYRFVARDGGIFSFGAPFFGNALGRPQPTAAMANRPQNDGYWIVSAGGTVTALGAARDLGSVQAEPLSSIAVRFTPVVTGLASPTSMTVRANDPALYVTEKGGTVRAVRDGAIDPTPVLTITDITSSGERGLLGLAFSPDGASMFTYHTDGGGDLVIAQYPFANGRADAAARRLLVTVEHSARTNHNGGDLQIGPDGALYAATGDGGGGGDPDGNGQNLNSLLGKILRIDFRLPTASVDVFAYGLRNPWRIAFDRQTGDLWIGDVGQDSREEINVDVAPIDPVRNYGWNRFEGTRPFAGAAPANATFPVHDYATGSGGDCSVTGGRVYRGAAIPQLRGTYVFGDFCSGRVALLRQSNEQLTDLAPNVANVSRLVSFAEDAAGEIYAVSIGGTISRLTAA
jgi:glucose/arabinose dehydrogenase